MAIFGRGTSFRPHVAKPIVSTSAPVSSLRPIPRVKDTAPLLQRYWLGAGRSKALHALVAAAIVAPAPSFIAKANTFAHQAIPRAQTARRVTQPPHLPPALINPVQVAPPKPIFVGVGVTSLINRRDPLLRKQYLPHLPPALFDPQPPPVAGATLIYDAVRRPVLSRVAFRPHLAPVNLTAPTPVTPLAPTKHITKQARLRALIGRQVPTRPNRWPRIEGVAATFPPLPATLPHTLVANRRANIGRRIIAAHTPPEIIGVAPFNYKVASTFKSLFRRPVRPILLPHLAKPIVVPGQPVIPTATITLYHDRVNKSSRHFPAPHLAPPSLTVPLTLPLPLIQTIRINRVPPRPVVLTPRAHLATATSSLVITPGRPVIAGHTKKTHQAKMRAQTRRRVAQRPVVARNTLSVAVTGATTADLVIILGAPVDRWFVFPPADRWRARY